MWRNWRLQEKCCVLELARKLGVAATAITRLDRGKVLCPLPQVLLAPGVDIAELLLGLRSVERLYVCLLSAPIGGITCLHEPAAGLANLHEVMRAAGPAPAPASYRILGRGTFCLSLR
jgi:hypothetical protein